MTSATGGSIWVPKMAKRSPPPPVPKRAIE
jgi:hypothetical protein